MLLSDNYVVGCGREQRQSVDNAVTAELERAVCTRMTRLLGKATIAPVARRSTTCCRLLLGGGGRLELSLELSAELISYWKLSSWPLFFELSLLSRIRELDRTLSLPLASIQGPAG